MQKGIERAALSVDESCAYIGVGRAHLYRLMDLLELPSIHIGRRRLVLKEDLDKFLQDRKAAEGA